MDHSPFELKISTNSKSSATIVCEEFPSHWLVKGTPQKIFSDDFSNETPGWWDYRQFSPRRSTTRSRQRLLQWLVVMKPGQVVNLSRVSLGLFVLRLSLMLSIHGTTAAPVALSVMLFCQRALYLPYSFFQKSTMYYRWPLKAHKRWGFTLAHD